MALFNIFTQNSFCIRNLIGTSKVYLHKGTYTNLSELVSSAYVGERKWLSEQILYTPHNSLVPF